MISWTRHSVLRWLCALTLIAGSACGDDANDEETGGTGGSAGKSGSGGKGGSGGAKAGSGGSGSNEDAGAAISAADLRVALDLLLSEHITLAAKTTGALLGKRTEETGAYLDLLNKNGTDLGDLVGVAYGDSGKNAFNTIWSEHNGYFADYTQAVLDKDEGKQTEAVNKLKDSYVVKFAALLAPVTGLEKSKIAEMAMEHVVQTKEIVDTQAVALESKSKDDWAKVYTAFRKAFAHMVTMGDAIGEAVAAKLPDEFKGDPKAASAELRVGLNEALQEHLYLATFATGAALGGRTGEFEAAGDALNTNGTDIGDVIGMLFNAEAKTKFNGIWSAHNGYFVDYTKAVAAKSDADKKKAVDKLTMDYVPTFADFLHGATDASADTLKTLITDHVTMTKAVVDAQGGGASKAVDAAKADRTAAQHMQHLGDPLADAIAKKLKL